MSLAQEVYSAKFCRRKNTYSRISKQSADELHSNLYIYSIQEIKYLATRCGYGFTVRRLFISMFVLILKNTN